MKAHGLESRLREVARSWRRAVLAQRAPRPRANHPPLPQAACQGLRVHREWPSQGYEGWGVGLGPCGPVSVARAGVRAAASRGSRCAATRAPGDVQVRVDTLVREEALGEDWVERLGPTLATLEADCEAAVVAALENLDGMEENSQFEVSVLITGDEEIRELNSTWRGIDQPTDVLSFPNGETPPGYDANILGDVVISAPTALAQAIQRGHGLHKEMRILLIHGMLHLLGYDHEPSESEARRMSDEEERILDRLKCDAGGGLIKHTTGPSNSLAVARPIKLVALDMDGTLLDESVRVSSANARALKACRQRGVPVVLATGKARPAALEACAKSGLGDMFDTTSPGIFIQGLLVYGFDGEVISQSFLPKQVVRDAFEFAQEQRIACCAFMGDRIFTLKQHWRLDELHEKYLEPKSEVVPSLEHIASQSVHKVLYYAERRSEVEELLKPHWEMAAPAQGADVTQAIPEMLELVPSGLSKASGLQKLLAQCGVDSSEVMAVGDGDNDVDMLKFVGTGVAVRNAVPALLDVADAVVAANTDDGVAEAIQRYVLGEG